MFVFSYNEHSMSARVLARALNGKRIRHTESVFVGNPNKIVINWGSSKITDEVAKCRVLNKPDEVALASDKIAFFNWAHARFRIPAFTTDKGVANFWLNNGHTVVARTVVRGHSAEGLFIVEPTPNSLLMDAPLYTRYIPKKNEYRVHFMNGNIIDVQRKALRPGHDPENVNWKVRNLNGGFIFVRDEELSLTHPVLYAAMSVITHSGLDFGAIDIIFNERHGMAYVLEINTAPGLMGTTLNNYAEAFIRNYATPDEVTE